MRGCLVAGIRWCLQPPVIDGGDILEAAASRLDAQIGR